MEATTVEPADSAVHESDADVPIANVDANLFRAAHICVGSEEARYCISGVSIEPHPDQGALLVATDGCRLMVIHDEGAWCKKPAIVRLSPIALRTCRNNRDGSGRRLIVDSKGRGRVPERWTSGNLPVTVDGVFPDWRKIVPVKKWTETPPRAFNGKYLGAFGEISSIISDDKSKQGIRILTNDDSSGAALILFPYCDIGFGLLMPMKTNEPTGLPRWMMPVMRGKPTPKVVDKPKKARARKRKAARK